MRKPLRVVLICAASALIVMPAGSASALNPDTLVTVGSPSSPFSANKQNEPAVAIDANHPTVLAAGANDNIDMEACNAGDPTTCPFTDGVGTSGVQFSFDSGDTWIQPTYTGWSARHCVGAPGLTCTPQVGSIGTLPWYFEEGLVSDGDPAVTFGPQPGPDGTFDWANGSRLYFANLTSNFSAERKEQNFKGFEGIGVSRIDGQPALTPQIVADKNNWMRPVIASKQSSATFADKEQIWADNAESSDHFGNVYVCYAAFRGGGAAPLVVATSRDGGDTWANKQVSPAHNLAPRHFGQSGCTVRTDSQGVVYVFYEEFVSPSVTVPPPATHFLVKSVDGGVKWTRPIPVQRVTDPCFFVDPVIARCVMDGVAGARSDLAAAPSADIANGAPTGADATDQIVLTWVDGRDGRNDEHVMVSSSTDRGASWSAPAAVES
ncbi:MAG: sialidase family protein, partial [Micromonosporaceae bacterium]